MEPGKCFPLPSVAPESWYHCCPRTVAGQTDRDPVRTARGTGSWGLITSLGETAGSCTCSPPPPSPAPSLSPAGHEGSRCSAFWTGFQTQCPLPLSFAVQSPAAGLLATS